MSICHKCGGVLQNGICAACGYDPSRDYGRYPTFAMLPGRTIPQPRREPDDAAACPGCGGKQFFFRPGAKELVCVRCGHTLAVSAPQPAAKPAVKPAPVPDAVKPQAHRPVPSIKAIAAGANHTVVLYLNGTVRAVGDNSAGQCDTDSWKNIEAIAAAGNLTVGLKSDGTIVVTGASFLLQSASACRDIKAIATGGSHILALNKL